ncbi:MAG: carboxylesterase/lipase family protein [Gammaproteobacteria bacterium]|nr:carboxylesterase/lipase family protein [Gammaproteobacteria bacterium]
MRRWTSFRIDYGAMLLLFALVAVAPKPALAAIPACTARVVAEAAPAGMTIGNVSDLALAPMPRLRDGVVDVPANALGDGAPEYCLVTGRVVTDPRTRKTANFAAALPARAGGMGEDCLHLNIWTPGVNDGRRRAVMVSFHGGAFSVGSSNTPEYDGAQLAMLGDVVVVAVNHRLNAFGFLDLSSIGGKELRDSGVAGMLDLVAALRWVQENIANFGGDPGSVLIFGQSGGGTKVTTLMAMPSARGLFHRAAVQSGSFLMRSDDASALKTTVLRRLGTRSIRKIQELPWQQLLDAVQDLPMTAFWPVAGNDALPGYPFIPSAPEISAHVPLIVSRCLEDAGGFGTPDFDLTESALYGGAVSAARMLCLQLSSSFIEFAKTGRPHSEYIPHWLAFDANRRAIMIFDTTVRVENDPRSEIRRFWADRFAAHPGHALVPG